MYFYKKKLRKKLKKDEFWVEKNEKGDKFGISCFYF